MKAQAFFDKKYRQVGHFEALTLLSQLGRIVKLQKITLDSQLACHRVPLSGPLWIRIRIPNMDPLRHRNMKDKLERQKM